MHVLLASDSSDPSFAAEEPSAESLALVAATLDEEIEAVFAHLPESEVLEPIAGPRRGRARAPARARRA